MYNLYMLIYSSILFLINTIISIIFNNYIYALLFLFLTITSVLFHYNPIYYYLDQFAILLIVLYGIYTFIKKFILTIMSVIILYTFILSLLLFYGGYYLQEFCYCKQYGNNWHFILHLLTIIGHMGIIIM